MKAAVIVFPGSNRDRDMRLALQRVSGKVPLTVWHGDAEIPAVDLIVLPGGFSYGDYLRCGAMAAHSPVMREVKARADKGVRVLAVCNGFQIATETGLLPGALLSNATLKFICRDVHLRVENSQSEFTAQYRNGQVVRVPVAHHDGNYFADKATVERLEGEGQVAFRYCDEAGTVSDATNLNGSVRNIAGIFNARRNVLGLMPHPEDATDAKAGGLDGMGLFASLAEALV